MAKQIHRIKDNIGMKTYIKYIPVDLYMYKIIVNFHHEKQPFMTFLEHVCLKTLERFNF